ncbi:MAG TPA: 5-(carboxyamino)imidazole ribonucleotide synthase [Opitutaceae bacterium]|nr:5-(carboxyamino)imidazole ribonucleotide synthase [Opitutaceae bacterium]
MIGPGQAIGILGGGQLARMLAQAAHELGYRVHVFEPYGPGTAGAVAERLTRAPYGDVAALEAFARSVDVATCETEDIPAEALEAIGAIVEVHPSPEVLGICRDRWRQKAWLGAGGFPHARHAEALGGDVEAAASHVGLPCVVKAADFGCDGKGQMTIATGDDLVRAAAIFRGRRCVVEQWIESEREICVTCARSRSGETRTFPAAESLQQNNILDVAIVPARIPASVEAEARGLAAAVADRLGAVGLVAVEMFVTRSGGVIVNELAPRPHDSGHWSIDGGETSHFEQLVRALCGLPLGPAGARNPTVMVNILGDSWKWLDGALTGEPDWRVVLAEPRAKLHVYGGPEPRPGRRMGHFTVQGAEVEGSLSLARELKARL